MSERPLSSSACSAVWQQSDECVAGGGQLAEGGGEGSQQCGDVCLQTRHSQLRRGGRGGSSRGD